MCFSKNRNLSFIILRGKVDCENYVPLLTVASKVPQPSCHSALFCLLQCFYTIITVLLCRFACCLCILLFVCLILQAVCALSDVYLLRASSPVCCAFRFLASFWGTRPFSFCSVFFRARLLVFSVSSAFSACLTVQQFCVIVLSSRFFLFRFRS